MRKMLFLAVFAALALGLSACKEKTPTVNGKTVLTNAQYNDLMNKIKGDLESKEQNVAVATDTASGSSFYAGANLYQNRDFKRAVTEFESAVANDPSNAKAWYMLGSSYEHIGNIEKAQHAFKRSYDLMVEHGYIPDNAGMM